MKSKRYLKNPANPALPLLKSFLTILITASLFGCSTSFEPTYKERDIPEIIKKTCAEEFKMAVATQLAGNTLWVYYPIDRIINKDYEVTKDKLFDEEMSNKLRNLTTVIGRVLISADRSPDFFCLVISDIKERALDYMLIANALDIKKTYANFLPWPEMNKRYVVKLLNAPNALGDSTGEHIQPYDISWNEFIGNQISQRIESRFREDDYKALYSVKEVTAQFTPTTLVVNADIKMQELRIGNIRNDKIIGESLKIIAQVIRAYNFKDFIQVEIHDTIEGKNSLFSRQTVEAIKE